MIKETVLGIDMGGSNLRAGLVKEQGLSSIVSRRINATGSFDEVVQELFQFIDQFKNDGVSAIGIGVPGLADANRETIYDVLNIPSWKEVPLKKLIEEKFHLPALVENDANCFALGEFHYGKGKGHDSMIGLTIGTGLGSGIIINKKLYSGKNGGAGEFGMIDYLDKYLEYYACGQFFKNVYGIEGELVFSGAKEGDKKAIEMYEEMGVHFGNAIKTILYAFDTDLIILGGSVRHAFPYFSTTMWQQIQSFPYKRAIGNLKIEVSELENSGILGAAALHYDIV